MKCMNLMVLTIALSSFARAQDRPPAGAGGPDPERVFQALDADRDGRIDRDELRKKLPDLLDRWSQARAERPRMPSPDRGADGPPPEMAMRIRAMVEDCVRDTVERRLADFMKRVQHSIDERLKGLADHKSKPIGPPMERPGPAEFRKPKRPIAADALPADPRDKTVAAEQPSRKFDPRMPPCPGCGPTPPAGPMMGEPPCPPPQPRWFGRGLGRYEAPVAPPPRAWRRARPLWHSPPMTREESRANRSDTLRQIPRGRPLRDLLDLNRDGDVDAKEIDQARKAIERLRDDAPPPRNRPEGKP